jgi:DNA-binding LytR/AlgR family response regulator
LDDELLGLTYLKMLCEQIPELEIVKIFNSPEQLLEEKDSLQYDLCIIDVEMPLLNGFQVANLMQDKLFIFITAYREYAYEAFEINAVDYIQKPIKKERLKIAIQKAIERLDKQVSQKTSITLQTDKGKTVLYFDSIQLIKTSAIDSRDKEVLLDNGDTLTVKNIAFEKFLEMLPESNFCRINKNEILAISVVKYFSADQIVTTILHHNKLLAVTLGNSYKNEFFSKLSD